MLLSCCSARKEAETTCVTRGKTCSHVGSFAGLKRPLELEVARRILSFASYDEWHALSLITKGANVLCPVIKWQKTTEGPVIWKNFAAVVYASPRHLQNPALQKHYTDRWMLKIFESSKIPLQLPCINIEIQKQELGGFAALDELWRKKERFFGEEEISIFQATWQSFVPKSVLFWKVTVLWPKKELTGKIVLSVWHDYLLFDWDIYEKRWEVRHNIGEEGRPDYSYQAGSPLIPKERRVHWVDWRSLSWIQSLRKGKLVGAQVDLRRRCVRVPGQVTRYFQDLPMCLGHVSLQYILDRMTVQTEWIKPQSKTLLRKAESQESGKERAIIYRF